MKDIFLKILLLCLPLTCLSQAVDQTKSVEILKIGQSYGGGIIFFIDTTGGHGLIVSKFDIGAELQYGCNEMETFANSLYDGANNTAVLSRHCGSHTAAYQCSHLDIDGYKDWYLPSINELNLMFNAMLPPDFFNPDMYMSSTEYNEIKAWVYDNSKGIKTVLYKDKTAIVRAIRKF